VPPSFSNASPQTSAATARWFPTFFRQTVHRGKKKISIRAPAVPCDRRDMSRSGTALAHFFIQIGFSQ